MTPLPRRRIDPRPSSRGSQGGYTLVEIMVAMLLTSIMVTSVFSVALTVKGGGSKGESKIKASAGARQVAALLKNYVTGDPDGPGGPGTGTNSWSMTSGDIEDECGCPGCSLNCYALEPGVHKLKGVMGDFEKAPPEGKSAYISYTVEGAIGTAQKVKIETTWDGQ